MVSFLGAARQVANAGYLRCHILTNNRKISREGLYCHFSPEVSHKINSPHPAPPRDCAAPMYLIVFT